MIRFEGPTLGDALDQAARELTRAGVPGARTDARLLVAHAAGETRETVMGYPERVMSPDALEDLAVLVLRRIEREPMAHLLGYREFWSLRFKVTADTLDPRPDSETLVEGVLAALSDRNCALRILDLGTGTGCLLLALLSELPNASGVGIDASPSALAVARENGEVLGFGDRAAFHLGNWGRPLEPAFDVIVTNPPYIPESDIDALEPEVALHEPRYALAGGADGLAAYRGLLPDVTRLLARDGLVAVEVGVGQAPVVAAMMTDAGMSVTVRQDLAGVERCLLGRFA